MCVFGDNFWVSSGKCAFIVIKIKYVNSDNMSDIFGKIINYLIHSNKSIKYPSPLLDDKRFYQLSLLEPTKNQMVSWPNGKSNHHERMP